MSADLSDPCASLTNIKCESVWYGFRTGRCEHGRYTLVDNSFRDARLTARPFHAKFASLAPTLSNNRRSSAALSLCRRETHTRIFRSRSGARSQTCAVQACRMAPPQGNVQQQRTS
jgi:hypothetical protein